MRTTLVLLGMLGTAMTMPVFAQSYIDGILDVDLGNLPPGVVAPKAITPHSVFAADYPTESIGLQETGSTNLRFVVLEDGSVGTIQVLQSSGHQRLDEASIAMIQSRWRYAPAMSNGQAIRVWQHASVVWRLAAPPASPK